MNRTAFPRLIQRIEDELATSYGFVISVSAAECLTQSAEAVAAAAENRAALILRSCSDELELGLYFQPQLIESMESCDPFVRLDSQNLDAFCVAVEEVSHFHLVINRVQSNQGISRLELEWQGEIDKLLLSSTVLQNQTGDPHLLPLIRLIFDNSYSYTQDHALYDEAHRLAARYCYKILRSLQDGPRRRRASQLRDACRQTYDLVWGEKLRAIDNL